MKRRLIFVITPLLATILLAILAPGAARLTAQASKAIAVIDSAFQPASLSIAAGTTVTWTSSGATAHTSTSDDALWDSGQLSSQLFARTFNTPGTYAYHCTFHPQTMRGTITVVAPSYLPVIIGPRTNTSATATATVRPSPTATLSVPTKSGIVGQIRVRPRWAVTTTERIPTQYEIVLDASESMSWNFAGQAGNASSPIQCIPTNPACAGQAWEPAEERRVAIVKQALNGLIDELGPDDAMRITAFSGNLAGNFGTQNAIDGLTQTLPASGWSGDKIVLKEAVSDAGAVNNDPYLTSGLAPSATGLAAATQVFATAPITAPNGLAYKRVAIFLTDSVANVFLDGEVNNGTGGCSPPGGYDIGACQVGVATGGRSRPITAMVEQADALKQLAHIYAIALAGVDETGLASVASAPSYPFFATAQSGADLEAILGDIWSGTVIGTCMPAGGNTWVGQIDAQHTATLPPPYTLPSGVFGYAYLYDENGVALPGSQHKLPITHDPGSGLLTFGLPASQGLAPGAYMLNAFAGYKGEDAISRIYNVIFNPATETSDTSITFIIDPAAALGPIVTLDAIHLDMTGTVC
jgi:plastocyanin